MKTLKTIELKGIQLDYAILKMEKYDFDVVQVRGNPELWHKDDICAGGQGYLDAKGNPRYTVKGQAVGLFGNPLEGFTRCWEVAGPIIERERVEFVQMGNPDYVKARTYRGQWASGDTMLEAAGRAVTISHFGETVEIPEELL